MKLTDAAVIGYFSLPALSLAETNPDAYNNAMAAAPAGAGTCAHCGTGIRHHVVIRTAEGQTAFIGTDCAVKVGGEVAACVCDRMTSEQKAAGAARQAERQAKQQAMWEAEKAQEVARLAARFPQIAEIVTVLDAQGTDFHSSLAHQLRYGPISWKQAQCAVKAVLGRRNKRNAVRWDELTDKCTASWKGATTNQ